MTCFARARPLGSALAIAAGLVLVSPSARAGDPATAQALFDQGRKLMKEERWAEACPKLEESQRLDPAGGTLLHLALCREHEGRIATAWALYQDALSQSKQDGRKDRAKIAQERIDALAPRLPRLRVRVAAGNRKIEGFTVLRDEIAMGEAQWGESLPVDPGARSLTARAKGRRPFTALIEVPPRADEIVIEVPVLEVDPDADTRPAGGGGSGDATPGSGRPPEDGKRGDTQRIVGLTVGGLGVAGLALGSVFGIISLSKSSEADSECQPPDRKLCTPAGVEAGDDALAAGNVSTVAFIAGGALLAGGVALYFTAPSGSSVAIGPGRVGPREASVALTARFW